MPFIRSSIPNFQYFFSVFHLVSKLLKSLFSHFLLLSNCMSWVFDFRDVQKLEHQLIFETFYYCYIWKVWFFLIVPLQTFFWSVNCTILVCKLCLLFHTVLDLWPVLILEVFSSEWSVQFLVTFLAVFFWSSNCKNQVCIS